MPYQSLQIPMNACEIDDIGDQTQLRGIIGYRSITGTESHWCNRMQIVDGYTMEMDSYKYNRTISHSHLSYIQITLFPDPNLSGTGGSSLGSSLQGREILASWHWHLVVTFCLQDPGRVRARELYTWEHCMAGRDSRRLMVFRLCEVRIQHRQWKEEEHWSKWHIVCSIACYSMVSGCYSLL